MYLFILDNISLLRILLGRRIAGARASLSGWFVKVIFLFFTFTNIIDECNLFILELNNYRLIYNNLLIDHLLLDWRLFLWRRLLISILHVSLMIKYILSFLFIYFMALRYTFLLFHILLLNFLRMFLIVFRWTNKWWK